MWEQLKTVRKYLRGDRPDVRLRRSHHVLDELATRALSAFRVVLGYLKPRAGEDTLTEERILNHLAGIVKGRTVILISHRVSTVREADSIVALENGRIAQQGAHAELIEAGGYYADLSRRQMLEEELAAT